MWHTHQLQSTRKSGAVSAFFSGIECADLAAYKNSMV
jgi:hypothetical protein